MPSFSAGAGLGRAGHGPSFPHRQWGHDMGIPMELLGRQPMKYLDRLFFPPLTNNFLMPPLSPPLSTTIPLNLSPTSNNLPNSMSSQISLPCPASPLLIPYMLCLPLCMCSPYLPILPHLSWLVNGLVYCSSPCTEKYRFLLLH